MSEHSLNIATVADFYNKLAQPETPLKVLELALDKFKSDLIEHREKILSGQFSYVVSETGFDLSYKK